MPRFYFDIREGQNFFADETGADLPNLDRVESEAVDAAATIMRDLTGKISTAELIVEVRDEGGARVLDVRATLEIARRKQP